MSGDESLEPHGSARPVVAHTVGPTVAHPDSCRALRQLLLLAAFTLVGWLLIGTGVSHAAPADGSPGAVPGPPSSAGAAQPGCVSHLTGAVDGKAEAVAQVIAEAAMSRPGSAGARAISHVDGSAAGSTPDEVAAVLTHAATRPVRSVAGSVTSVTSPAGPTDPVRSGPDKTTVTAAADAAKVPAVPASPDAGDGATKDSLANDGSSGGSVVASCAPGVVDGTHLADGEPLPLATDPASATPPNVSLTTPDTDPDAKADLNADPNTDADAPDMSGVAETPAGVLARTATPAGVTSVARSLGGPPTESAWPGAARFDGRSAPTEPAAIASPSPSAAAGSRAHPVRADLPGGPPVPTPGNSTPDQRSPQAPPPEQTVVELSGPGQAHSAGESLTLPVDGCAVRLPSRVARSAGPGVKVRGAADEPSVSPD